MRFRHGSDASARTALRVPRCPRARCAVGVVILVVAASHVSTVPAPGQRPAGESSSRTAAAIGAGHFDARTAVAALVNRNPAPAIEAGSYKAPVFGGKYDWAEYRRVWELVPLLVRHAEEAWPELVKHLDDGRYCTTFQSESGFAYNWSVGDVCREVIGRSVSEAYFQKLEPLYEVVFARMRMPAVSRDAKKLKSWCEERADKKLYELQIEMCRWAISELSPPDGLPSFVSRPTVRGYIAAIEAEAGSLAKSKAAVPFLGFGTEEVIRYTPETAGHPPQDKK